MLSSRFGRKVKTAGIWSLPFKNEQRARALIKLLEDERLFDDEEGWSVNEVQEKLYSIFGTDELFDALDKLRPPQGAMRKIILNKLSDLIGEAIHDPLFSEVDEKAMALLEDYLDEINWK